MIMARLGSLEDNEPIIKVLTKGGGMIRMRSPDESNEDEQTR